MRHLNPDFLQAFSLVCDLGSFSAAAERLGLSQPAVSLQVRQLEQRYGLRLLERVGRHVLPTAAGEDLLAHARGVAGALAAADDSMARHAGGVIGRVRLGTGATACIYLLPAVLRDLRRAMPALEIVVSTENTGEALKGVEDNALDLAFVTLPASGRMFDITPLLEDPFVAIGPADDAALPATVTPADLAGRPLVLFSPGGNTRRLVDEWFLRAGISARPVMELDSVEAIKELVGAGLGYSVLPGMALPPGQPRARIAVRPLAPPLARTLALVLRHDKPLRAGLRATVAALLRLAPEKESPP
ncbi:LysR family transcriptional regulator [Cupriavidus sp. CuC1]|uniref:LysR family transcriptional regulator n=1 Tax=Cupriavidus sp. CuC1 TaxID=3373131 RepID=UPI0037D65FFE